MDIEVTHIGGLVELRVDRLSFRLNMFESRQLAKAVCDANADLDRWVRMESVEHGIACRQSVGHAHDVIRVDGEPFSVDEVREFVGLLSTALEAATATPQPEETSRRVPKRGGGVR